MIRVRGGGGPRPLGKTTSLAMGNGWLYVGTADSASVEAYGMDGQGSQILRVGVDPRKPSREHVENALEDFLMVVPAFMREEVRHAVLAEPVPSQLPPYSMLFADHEGVLWAVLSAPGDGRTRLRAIRNDGAILADVQVPVELTVFEIGDDYVLGRYQDEIGRPYIVLFNLHRGRRPVGG